MRNGHVAMRGQVLLTNQVFQPGLAGKEERERDQSRKRDREREGF